MSVQTFGKPYARALSLPGATAPRGIHGEHPSSTPKYVLGQSRRDYTETMARLFVQVTPRERKRFLDSVQTRDPTSRTLAESLSGWGYLDFLLQRASHPYSEKVDVVETVADTYVAYFFGETAPTFSYSGVVLNSQEDDEAVNLFRMYRDIIRGSELARRRKRVSLAFDSFVVTGAVLSLQQEYGAENEMVVPFTFQLLASRVYLRLNAQQFGLVVPEEDFLTRTGLTDETPTASPTIIRTSAVPLVREAAQTKPPTDTAPKQGDDESTAILDGENTFSDLVDTMPQVNPDQLPDSWLRSP